MPTHANPCGAVTTWVVWANTWKKHMLWFLRYTFFALFFGSRRARTRGPILTIYTSSDVIPPKDVPFRVSFILLPILGGKIPQKNFIFGAWIGIFKLNTHTIEITAPITTKFRTVTKTTKYSSWVVPKRVKQIQDGGRPPSWKSKIGHISGTVWPIFAKFGVMTHIAPPNWTWGWNFNF